MDAETEALVERAQNPRLIPGIYNYCNRRCERCAFTDRCLTYADVRDYERRHPAADALDPVRDSFRKTWALIEAWCEREGIDFEKLRAESNSDSARAAERRADDEVWGDPLHQLAWSYTSAAFEIVKSLENAAPFHAWPRRVRDAIDTIGWSSGMVSAKTHRALHGLRGREDEPIEWDEIQNDWNGSAKVARLVIADTLAAWEVLLADGRAAADSPLRQIVSLLQRVEAGLAERFPRAMEFVRPGFDEPEITSPPSP